jgi:hypothetical protein
MRWSALGLVTGLVAGLALAFDGFGAFLIVLLFGAIGLVAGMVADGELDLTRFRDGVSGIRSSVSSIRSGGGRSWRPRR